MSKPVTLQDIAGHAHVSIATVSRFLNNPSSVRESTQKKVLRSMTELGFIQTAPKLPKEPSHTILIIIETLSNQFDTDLANIIVNTAYFHGYNSMVVVHNNNYKTFESYENFFKDISIAGIILETGLIDSKLVNELALHYPTVMCSDFIENLDIPHVGINDAAAAKTATDYLISTGHTKIALINCNPDYKISRQREKGFRESMANAGLTPNEGWILRLSTMNYFLVHSYIRQMLEKDDRPDAIFACSDIYGMAAINAAHQLGLKVPEELSIIGFDNTNTSSMTEPSLTTVAQPIAQMGVQACELLIEKIRDPKSPSQQIILDTELVIRNSTCPKKH